MIETREDLVILAEDLCKAGGTLEKTDAYVSMPCFISEWDIEVYFPCYF